MLTSVNSPPYGEQPVSRQLESFVLRLPAESSGSLTVAIKGLNRDGCSIAEGSTTSTLQAGEQTVAVSLTSLGNPAASSK